MMNELNRAAPQIQSAMSRLETYPFKGEHHERKA